MKFKRNSKGGKTGGSRDLKKDAKEKAHYKAFGDAHPVNDTEYLFQNTSFLNHEIQLINGDLFIVQNSKFRLLKRTMQMSHRLYTREKIFTDIKLKLN